MATLLDQVSEIVRDDCVERTARKAHHCHTFDMCREDGSSRKIPLWAAVSIDGCRSVIGVGEKYVEYVGESHAYESGKRYCSGCVEQGHALGKPETET